MTLQSHRPLLLSVSVRGVVSVHWTVDQQARKGLTPQINPYCFTSMPAHSWGTAKPKERPSEEAFDHLSLSRNRKREPWSLKYCLLYQFPPPLFFFNSGTVNQSLKSLHWPCSPSRGFISSSNLKIKLWHIFVYNGLNIKESSSNPKGHAVL